MKNNKYIRLVSIGLCIAVLCCLSFVLSGAAQDPDIEETKPLVILKELDWTMNAMVLSSSGEIQKTFPLTIDGPITLDRKTHQMDFQIHIPDEAQPEVPWKYSLLDEGHMRRSPFELDADYYIWFNFCTNYVVDGREIVELALCTEKEYLIAYWNDGEDHLLVAAKDPNVTAAEIQEYFNYFIDKYATPFANQQQ